MRTRGGGLTTITSLASVTALALGGCGSTGTGGGTGDTSATALGFKHYAGAVDYPSTTGPHNAGYVAPGEGLRQLVPLDDCALGLGTFANGYHYVNVN